MPEFETTLAGSGRRFGLVVGRFNDAITARLLDAATDCLVRHGVEPQALEVIRVPGAFEIPLAALKLAQTDRFDAVIALGAVIRGATPHFDQVAAQVARGVAQASLATGVPITFGVITADTLEQAVERAGTKAGNRGWDAALAALEMASVLEAIDQAPY